LDTSVRFRRRYLSELTCDGQERLAFAEWLLLVIQQSLSEPGFRREV
jgi:hypothetical protein